MGGCGVGGEEVGWLLSVPEDSLLINCALVCFRAIVC